MAWGGTGARCSVLVKTLCPKGKSHSGQAQKYISWRAHLRGDKFHEFPLPWPRDTRNKEIYCCDTRGTWRCGFYESHKPPPSDNVRGISLSIFFMIPSTSTTVAFWCYLVNKIVSVTPKTNITWRKLRVSAFQRYQGLGVADRVFMAK